MIEISLILFAVLFMCYGGTYLLHHIIVINYITIQIMKFDCVFFVIQKQQLFFIILYHSLS